MKDWLLTNIPAKDDDEKIRLEKIRTILIALFGVFLPFDMFYSNLVLILIIVVSLLDLSLSKIKSIPPQFLLFAFAFLLTLLWLPLSEDSFRAHFLLERQLAFIIFPIILPLAIGVPGKTKVQFISLAFTLSCVYSVVFLLGSAVNLIWQTGLPIRYLFSYSFFNHNFSAPIGIHATYLSLYYSLAILIIMDELSAKREKWQQAAGYIGIFLLIIGLLFLQSRNGIISLAINFFFIFPWFRVRNKKRYFSILLVVVSLVGLILSQSDYIRQRFTTELNADINARERHQFTARNPEPRIWRWRAAMEVIRERPVLGHGSGDEIPELLRAYERNDLKVSFREQFNAHNQYLAVWIKHGIIGLSIFIGAFVFFFRLAIQSRNFIYAAFLSLICLGLFTEDIVDANKGIFFFALFNTLLGYNALYRLQQTSQHQL